MGITGIFKGKEEEEKNGAREDLVYKIKKAEKVDDYRRKHEILSEAYYMADKDNLELPQSYYSLSNEVLKKVKEDLVKDIETCLENDRGYFARAAAYSLEKAYERLGETPPSLSDYQINLKTKNGLTLKTLNNKGGER